MATCTCGRTGHTAARSIGHAPGVTHMNDQNKARVTAWLAERGVTVKCGVCGSTDWQLHGEVIEPARNDGVEAHSVMERFAPLGGGVIHPSSIRLVAVICQNCAAVTMLHADTIGV